MSKIPGIGDIPILGLLFRSKAHQKNQTELVVMITPTIIRRGQTGVSEGLPSARRALHGRAVEDSPESRSVHRIAPISDQPEAAEQRKQQTGASGAGCTGAKPVVASVAGIVACRWLAAVAGCPMARIVVSSGAGRDVGRRGIGARNAADRTAREPSDPERDAARGAARDEPPVPSTPVPSRRLRPCRFRACRRARPSRAGPSDADTCSRGAGQAAFPAVRRLQSEHHERAGARGGGEPAAPKANTAAPKASTAAPRMSQAEARAAEQRRADRPRPNRSCRPNSRRRTKKPASWRSGSRRNESSAKPRFPRRTPRSRERRQRKTPSAKRVYRMPPSGCARLRPRIRLSSTSRRATAMTRQRARLRPPSPATKATWGG